MITIYQYDQLTAYFTGQSRQIEVTDPIPLCWTNDALPASPSGMYARYNFPGWVLTSDPAPVPPPPVDPVVEPVAEPAAQTAPTVI